VHNPRDAAEICLDSSRRRLNEDKKDRRAKSALFVEKQNSQPARYWGWAWPEFNAQRIGNLLSNAVLAAGWTRSPIYPQTYPHKLWRTAAIVSVLKNYGGF
jgi:hypothetical protein